MTEIYTYKKLYIAYLDCRKSKRNSPSALQFEAGLEKNLQVLLDELRSGRYEPGESICFVVREPMPREIFAAGFRDRIVHHLLVNELLPAGERAFIHDSYACRKGKGTHRAVKRLRKFIKIGQSGTKELYYVQLDISGFFMSINKTILIWLADALIDKQKKSALWKEEVKLLAGKIIRHDPSKNFRINSPAEFFKLIPGRKSLFRQPPGKGLPIGNYTSQFFANLYLNELDQFIKRSLKCRHYIRYVDDFILLSPSRQQLKDWMKEIDNFTRLCLDLKINGRKIRMQNVKKGLDFLGYFIKPDYALARKSVVVRFKKKIHDKKADEINDLSFKAMISSYFGHFKHADCRTLAKKYKGLSRCEFVII